MQKALAYSALSILPEVILLAASPAYSWGDKGHEIVAYVAEARLSGRARKQIDDILAGKSSLAEAATWPDRVGRTISDVIPLHFIGIAGGAKSYDRERDCPQRNCAVEAVSWYLKVLTSEDAPMNLRRIALRYIVHLVGDIHQPLHAGHKEDRGGNTIMVRFNGREENLHILWDIVFLEAEGGSSQDAARRLNEAITRKEILAWQKGTAADWAVESHLIAESVAYRLPETGEISEDYTSKAISVIHQRLKQAGVRLACALNKAFK